MWLDFGGEGFKCCLPSSKLNFFFLPKILQTLVVLRLNNRWSVWWERVSIWRAARILGEGCPGAAGLGPGRVVAYAAADFVMR